MRNQQASIQDLDKQIGHISKKPDERPQGRLPSDMETNPKEQCHAIITRSGNHYSDSLPIEPDVVISSDAGGEQEQEKLAVEPKKIDREPEKDEEILEEK